MRANAPLAVEGKVRLESKRAGARQTGRITEKAGRSVGVGIRTRWEPSSAVLAGRALGMLSDRRACA